MNSIIQRPWIWFCIFLSLAWSISLDGRLPDSHHFSFSDSKQQSYGFSNDISNCNDLNDDEPLDFEPIKVLCEINGYTIPAIIDTGAQITIMSASCAKRCRISNIDTRYSGRAIGVGTGDILGRIDNLPMRIGPLQFDNKVSILRESRVDLLIGLDFLRRFNCEISIKEKVVKVFIKNRKICLPFFMETKYDMLNHENSEARSSSYLRGGFDDLDESHFGEYDDDEGCWDNESNGDTDTDHFFDAGNSQKEEHDNNSDENDLDDHYHYYSSRKSS